jgi:methionyl-tRNA formyltransferase
MRVLFLGHGRDETRLPEFLAAAGHEVTWEPGAIRDLAGHDLAVSFGYRHVLPGHVLARAPRPPVNLHISFLPFNRGAHPNFWAWAESTPSGVTIHEIDAGIDTGPIIAQERFAAARDSMTLRETHAALLRQVEALFERHAGEILDGSYTPRPQHGPGSFHTTRELPGWVDWDLTLGEVRRRHGAG